MPEPGGPLDRELYIVARVGEALAEDERTSELGIEVTVAGGKVFLSGTVATRERREAVMSVACEEAGDLDVRNHITVADLSEAATSEELL